MNYKYLYVMFPKKDERVRFLSSAILTFGLSLDTISSLLEKDPNYFYAYISVDNPLEASVNKIFNDSLKSQIIAKEKFVDYFNKLEEAHNNDKEKYRKLLDMLTDKDFKKIKDKLAISRPHLSDEEIVIILKYQLKYMLSNGSVAFILQIDRKNYSNRVKALKDKYPELVDEYEKMMKFNQMEFLKMKQKKSSKRS